jgi:hypothetical protein
VVQRIPSHVRNKGRGGERQLLWYNRNVYLTKTTAFGRASFYKTKGHSPLYNKQTCTVIHHTTHSTTHSTTYSTTCSFIPTSHTIQTPHHHFIYMGIQGGGGVGRRRQVEEVEFLSKRDKWIGWDSLQEEISGRDAIPPNMVLLCANCCVQRRGKVSDVGYSQNCK